MVIYSAAVGQTAIDRLSDKDTNPNGVFTRELLKIIQQRGVSVLELWAQLANRVNSLAQSVGTKQAPAIFSASVAGDFYFFPPEAMTMQGEVTTQKGQAANRLAEPPSTLAPSEKLDAAKTSTLRAKPTGPAEPAYLLPEDKSVKPAPLTVAETNKLWELERKTPLTLEQSTDMGSGRYNVTPDALTIEETNRLRELTGQPILSEQQFELLERSKERIAVPAEAKPARATTDISTGCPNGYRITANAWEIRKLPPDLKNQAEELFAAAEARHIFKSYNSSSSTPAFSRTLGERLRNEVRIPASIDANIQVRILDPKTARLEQDMGVLPLINGAGSISLTFEQHTRLIELIWPRQFRSPDMSNGERRMWLFPEEWKGADACGSTVHGAF